MVSNMEQSNNVSDMFAPAPNVPDANGNYQFINDAINKTPFVKDMFGWMDWNRLDPNWKDKYTWQMNQADKKYQYEYDKANLANKFNVQDKLNQLSSKYNYELAQKWDQNKYKYNMEGQLKAGINPLIASIGSGGASGAPSGSSNNVSGSSGTSSNKYSIQSGKDKKGGDLIKKILNTVKDVLLISALL